ncbi:unnamed protein product [Arctia plantaginis]|uniref:Uncharacterized protein n=1 Tax=Arctia plantaginis TaxID=874455 RepID=A0A8S0ZMP7_ARCPL|nr:unnamed protein product [Arctia plantaginis]
MRSEERPHERTGMERIKCQQAIYNTWLWCNFLKDWNTGGSSSQPTVAPPLPASEMYAIALLSHVVAYERLRTLLPQSAWPENAKEQAESKREKTDTLPP